jgi:signal transduction histidine kinase
MVKVIRRVLTPAGVACFIVVVGAGFAWLHELTSAEQAKVFTEAQAVEAALRVQADFESAKLEARLMAAQPASKLGPQALKAWSFDTAVALPPDSAGRVEIRNTLRPASPSSLLSPGSKLQLAITPMSGDAPLIALYPAKSPTHLLVALASRDGMVALSAVNLRDLLRNINADETDYVEFELSESGSARALAKTDGWDSPATSAEASAAITQPLNLTLRTRPSKLYFQSIGRSHPGWTLFGSLVLAAIAYLLMTRLLASAKLIREKDAAWNAAQANHRANLEITLSNFTEAAGAMLWLARPEGDVQLFGPWPELEGRDSNLFTFEELTVGVREGASLIKSLVTAVNERASWAYTHQKDMDGERNVFQEGAAPVFTPLGLYLGLVGIRTNVSAVVRAQQSTSKTEAIRAGQETYLNRVSNEISAPAQQAVAALKFLKTAIEQGDNVSMARWLSTSIAAAEHVDTTVKSALEVMRQKGGGHLALASRKIDECVQDVVRASASAAARGNRSVVVRGKTARAARFSESGLARILDELISNALKFGPPGTTVTVAMGDDASKCFVSVTDEGPGMTDEELQRITRPFYRTASATHVEGRGLGMTTAKELAEAMGAQLHIGAGKSGKGLVATVTVPLAAGPEGGWEPSDFGSAGGQLNTR